MSLKFLWADPFKSAISQETESNLVDYVSSNLANQIAGFTIEH